MFLFPWLDWGNDISDFEKIDFLGSWAIFGFVSPLQEPFLTVGTFSQLGLESPRRKILENVNVFFSSTCRSLGGNWFFKSFYTLIGHRLISKKRTFFEFSSLRFPLKNVGFIEKVGNNDVPWCGVLTSYDIMDFKYDYSHK